jgi:hypothetical protein
MTYEDETPATAPAPDAAAAPVEEKKPEPTDAEKAFVGGWVKRIIAAEEHWEKLAFKKMKACQHIARTGGTKEWVGEDTEDGNYVVPILNRHINQSVAQLYAKNPTALAKRKRRRMHTVWDGKISSLQQAQMMTQAASSMMGMQPDPMTAAIMADIEQVRGYIAMMDGLADTLTLLHAYYMQEQAAGYKQLFKALVRRTKVNGVGYVTLGFQRMLEPRPEVTGKIHDTTQQIKHVEQLLREASREQHDEGSAKLEELRTALETLQGEEFIIAREGPVLGFPKSTAIILDPRTQHLKTLYGCGWWAEKFMMTPSEIEEQWKVDIRASYKPYTENGERKKPAWWSDKSGRECEEPEARVYRVQHKPTGTEFVVCEGYHCYVKAPVAPDVRIERFFTLFPLVFNECEDDDNIFPSSDVWQARHSQAEYNRARQGLRDHRKQNKPGYYSPTGSLSDPDKARLSARTSGEIVEVGALVEGQKLEDKLAAIPAIPIDGALYDVEGTYNDMLRSVGSQAANQGVTTGDTATESSIAENSRQVSEASHVDDLDDMLTEIARSMGQLMLTELSKETVVEIVGPGAVWPEMAQTRDEVAKDLALETKAGSSGRPNEAAELANMERGMPHIVQLPGVNPTPIAERYLQLLNIDVEGAVLEGMPSIVAMNAMANKPSAQPGNGDPQSDPGAQGDKGGDNAPKAKGNEPGAQPAMPAPGDQGPAAAGGMAAA